MPIKNSRKAQMSFFSNVLFIVAASIAFFLVLMYVTSFRKSTVEEREASEFKMGVLNVLQKLVSDKDCLSYPYNETSQKIFLDKNKIDSFVSNYDNVEPECAKAIGFDYNIKIIQFEYNFSLYPGEKLIQGELTLSNEFSSHPIGGGRVMFFDCNFNPKEHPDLCTQNTELDVWTCPDCRVEPRKNCPYPHGTGRGGICCVYYDCPASACKHVELKPGKGDCGSKCTVVKDCNLTECHWANYYAHGACGMTYDYIIIPSGDIINVSIWKKIWEFGLSAGVESFSPPKAKKEAIELSLPITIRYNQTFSAEGVIYIYAVRGELESLYSLLDDICEKAKVNDNLNIKFSRDFHFSYPVKYSNNDLCMLNSCKNFVCPYSLEFQDIDEEGDYILKFSFDPVSKKIVVEK